MRKIIMTAVGASLMLLSVQQIASARDTQARDNQDRRAVTRQSNIFNDTRARNANAEYRGDGQRVYGAGNADASLVAPAGR